MIGGCNGNGSKGAGDVAHLARLAGGDMIEWLALGKHVVMTGAAVFGQFIEDPAHVAGFAV